MVTAEIGIRVKKTRRGCQPSYGTVIGLDSAADAMTGERFIRVAWDCGVTCMVTEAEVTRVIRERRYRRG